MRGLKAPDVVVRRLALYLRILVERSAYSDDQYISSKELGDRAGVTSAQVRKDLAMFGEFGKQGVGYDSGYLREELRTILNAHKDVHVGLVGAGELGIALTRYNLRRFAREKDYPFRFVACFDNDPAKVGQRIDGTVETYPVAEIPRRVSELGLEMMLITVPVGAAQEVCDLCVRAGIRAILNFAPTKLTVSPNVRLHYADVSLDLQQLAYYL
ncbi:MAG: redox-sensing transcriptional repressor Rex [Bacillota bacterium]